MATSEVQTVHTGADKAKLAAAVVLLLGSFVAFYLLSSRGALVQWGALLVLMGAAVAFWEGEVAVTRSSRNPCWLHCRLHAEVGPRHLRGNDLIGSTYSVPARFPPDRMEGSQLSGTHPHP